MIYPIGPPALLGIFGYSQSLTYGEVPLSDKKVSLRDFCCCGVIRIDNGELIVENEQSEYLL